jgi:hypothetical protein
MGRRARERVTDRYSIERLLDNIDALYRALAEKGRSSAATQPREA